jgi:hypothetical protein
MVMNSWKEGGITNLPWMHPSVTAAVGRHRAALPPHPTCGRCSSARAISRTHHPAHFLRLPEDAQCLRDCDEFMLGRELLVAPVVEVGATTPVVPAALAAAAAGSTSRDRPGLRRRPVAEVAAPLAPAAVRAKAPPSRAQPP